MFCPQHHEFFGYRVVPIRNGSHDHATNSAQRYCSLQSDGISGMTDCYYLYNVRAPRTGKKDSGWRLEIYLQ